MADNGSDGNNYRGFFNQIVGGTVRNLTVATSGFGANPPSGEYGCAAIAGAAYNAMIENCVAEGMISGTHNVAGIVVRIKDTSIIGCVNRANVTGGYTKIGGICTLNQNSETACLIAECVNEGVITAANGATAGRDGVSGIIADVEDAALTIRNCANKGAVVKGPGALSSARVGQVVGFNYKGVKAFEGTVMGATDAPLVGDEYSHPIDCSRAVLQEDITKAVRDAGKGTTTRSQGTQTDGYKIDNAFGETDTLESRVMFNTESSAATLTIADDFEAGKPIVATRYTVRRAYYTGEVGGSNDKDYSRRRAPVDFRLQGSLDGSHWVYLDVRKGIQWGDEQERTFEIDPKVINGYRRYRFETERTNASAEDTVKCAYQYVKIFGFVGSEAPIAGSCAKPSYLFANGTANNKGGGTVLADYTPTLDSRIEIDMAFTAINGTRAVFAAGVGSTSTQMRLFCIDGVWTYFYGSTTKYTSTVKAEPWVDYHVVVDGPSVMVNGVKVIDAGARKTGATGTVLTLCGSYSTTTDKELYNPAFAKVRSVATYAADGEKAHELRPIVCSDGGGRWFDTVTGKIIANRDVVNKVEHDDYVLYPDEIDVTEAVRNGGTAPTVTLEEGSAHGSYPVGNLFTRNDASAGRALFADAYNVIRYDIPDSFSAGLPIVLTRYALVPCQDDQGASRAPSEFRLEGSVDGSVWVTLHEQGENGVGPGRFDQNAQRRGVVFEIPEGNRGAYRHYRFTTLKTPYTGDWKMGLQEIRFYGYCGGFEGRFGDVYKPVDYVQNAASGNTYYKTGIIPTTSEMTIEIKGEFTDVKKTGCLFCSRQSSSVATRSWTLFQMDGKVRFDYNAQGTQQVFKWEAGTPYTIKVVGNELYVNGGDPVVTWTKSSFVPYSEIVLMASHNAATSGWGNPAQFRLRRCRIWDAQGALLRDYVSVVRTTDNVAGLFDLVRNSFTPSSGAAAVAASTAHDVGEVDSLDADRRYRDRSVVVTTAVTEDGTLPRGPISFAFDENQRVGGTLYAAFDDECKGNLPTDWAKVEKIGDVKTGVDAFVIPKLRNSGHHSRVKFFICDALGDVVSHTRSYQPHSSGAVLIIR